jgi:DNA invertase Pin-like site-specific DNA recombinase
MPTKKIRVIGYTRVSTDEQAREGVSLGAQHSRIRAYCECNDLELVDVVEDAGVSAKCLHTRQGLQRVLADLEGGRAEALVVLKLDRLSRSTKDVIELTERFERCGWGLHSISEKLDTSTAAGRFVLTILAALAQMEREQVGERTRAALAYKKQNGERLGTTPLGYETVTDELGNRHLQPVGREQAVLKQIADLREAGTTYKDIAQRLNSEGVPTKRGGRWRGGTVYYLAKYVIPKGIFV